MKTIVISTAPFVEKDGEFYAYSPYIKEMVLWAKHSDEISFLCPVRNNGDGLLLSKVDFHISKIYQAKEFDLKSIVGIFRGITFSIYNFWLLFAAMRSADHIHLRCPGNISLMGCIVQMFFPRKPKSAKYAGNWDPSAKQPLSYKIQKWILNNTFLTRNMSVMAYGKWPGSSKNIKLFFTATYRFDEKLPIAERVFGSFIKFIFVGTLSEGKRPLYAIRLVETLRQSGINATLDFFGEGYERGDLEAYINDKSLSDFVKLRGNQDLNTVKQAYIESHFCVLPSKSEGWPKAVAEAMFWGCVPIASKVSCVPFMLDYGKRGILLEMDLSKDVEHVASIISNHEKFRELSTEAAAWSRQFTLEEFEIQIKNILNK